MANIAEGYGHYYYQEVIRFCYVARGSLEETYSHLVCANDLGYLNTEVLAEGAALYRGVQSMLNGYIGYLKRTKQGGPASKPTLKEPQGNSTPFEHSPLYLIP